MKFQLICLVSACLGLCACDLLRAPYLPSGWRPKGPAFELPTETKKTVVPTTEQTQDFESEGSTFLREYGPPNIVQESPISPVLDLIAESQPKILPENILQDLTFQALPDVETNLNFRINQDVNENANTTATDEKHSEIILSNVVGNEDSSDNTDETFKKLAVNQSEDTIEEVTAKLEENNQSVASEINKHDVASSQANDIKDKASFDVVLINEPKETEKTVDVKETEMKTEARSTPLGFLEYGPPAEVTTYRAPAYLPPRPLKRDARRARTSQRLEKWQ